MDIIVLSEALTQDVQDERWPPWGQESGICVPDLALIYTLTLCSSSLCVLQEALCNNIEVWSFWLQYFVHNSKPNPLPASKKNKLPQALFLVPSLQPLARQMTRGSKRHIWLTVLPAISLSLCNQVCFCYGRASTLPRWLTDWLK